MKLFISTSLLFLGLPYCSVTEHNNYNNIKISQKYIGEETTNTSILSSESSPQEENSITIPDNILRSKIMLGLGKKEGDTITCKDLEHLTSLSLDTEDTSEISSLNGLENAVNLEYLNIPLANKVVDFTPLEKLKNLRYVELKGTNVDNTVLEKLKSFSSLERIYLEHNDNITTIAPLKTLPRLKTLYVQFNGIHDFTVINEFSSLNILGAFGQNIGVNEVPSSIKEEQLMYNKDTQELFIPYLLMPNRLTNFDGYIPSFTNSTAIKDTKLLLNNLVVEEERLALNDTGISINKVSPEEFDTLTSFEFKSRIDNPSNNYTIPNNFSTYSISSGTYQHKFNIIHTSKKQGQPVTIRYLDNIGNHILSPEVLNGNLGDSFKILEKSVPGWAVKKFPKNTEGQFLDQPQFFDIIYEKNSKNKEENLLNDVIKKHDTKPPTIQKEDNSIQNPILQESPSKISDRKLFDFNSWPLDDSMTNLNKDYLPHYSSIKQAPNNIYDVYFYDTVKEKKKYSENNTDVNDGQVVIRYVDENGTDIIPPKKLKERIGKKKVIKAKKSDELNRTN